MSRYVDMNTAELQQEIEGATELTPQQAAELVEVARDRAIALLETRDQQDDSLKQLRAQRHRVREYA